jgi:YD repeat-containing protein
MTSDPNGRLMSYDAENRMLQYNPNLPGMAVTSYVYDGDGHRVLKQDNGGTQVFYAYDALGKLVAEYGGVATAGTHYATADHLGSTREVTDGTGQPVKRYDYFPFGEEVPASFNSRSAVTGYGASTDDIHQKFTSKERDNESGLDFFGARYYSGGQGRFLRQITVLINTPQIHRVGTSILMQGIIHYFMLIQQETITADPLCLLSNVENSINH